MRKEERFQGVVKWFNNAKGFGFILREEMASSSEDVSNPTALSAGAVLGDSSSQLTSSTDAGSAQTGEMDVSFSEKPLSATDSQDDISVGPEDVFVHYSAIEGDGFRTLQQGERVEFHTERGPKGFHAVSVKRLS